MFDFHEDILNSDPWGKQNQKRAPKLFIEVAEGSRFSRNHFAASVFELHTVLYVLSRGVSSKKP